MHSFNILYVLGCRIVPTSFAVLVDSHSNSSLIIQVFATVNTDSVTPSPRFLFNFEFWGRGGEENAMSPIRITIIDCTIYVPRVGWPGHLLFDRYCCKTFQIVHYVR